MAEKTGGARKLSRFATEWKKLPPEGRDDESTCYGQLFELNQGKAPTDLDRFLESRPAPEGCNRSIEDAEAPRRAETRLAVAARAPAPGRQLPDPGAAPAPLRTTPRSASRPTPIGGQEAAIYDIVIKGKANINTP